VATVAHGSARWATEREAREAGLLAAPEEGLHLGHFDPEHRRSLTDGSDHHVLVFAPPGVGKTTALVIPTLLRMRSSAWVLDPKGELWEATAEWRRRELGHECLRFAPADSVVPGWNPLLEIPRGPGDIAVATLFARNLVVAPAGGEVHWTLAARSLWTALALHVRWAKGRGATMAVLRATLSAHTDHDELFEELAEYEHDPNGEQGWRDPVTGEETATHPEVSLLARKFRATPPRERGSIVSTLAQYLDPWGDPRIAAATAESHLSLAGLLSGQPTTLYLSIPFHDLGRLSPLIRLQLAALGRRLTERPLGGVGGEARRLEVVVDEFASLGRLPILEELLAYFRGYDTRCFLLCQDLSQLHRLYGREETITGNCRVHVTTATQAPGTRRHASSLAGTATARYRRTSRSHGMAMRAGRRTSSMVETSRPLLTEGEVGTLDLGQALVFKAGMPPLKSYLRPYFRDPELVRRSWRVLSDRIDQTREDG
jgi:type IV secretion system protein VirD4